MSVRPPVLNSARWRRLIPIAFITYSFAYLDRSNYSIGSAGGLTDRLHISSTQSGLLGGLFFIGYFLFQVPAGSFAERRSVKSLLFWSLSAWGVLAALQGVVTTYWLLLVDRFLLGVVEAVVLPAMLVFLFHWFTRAERGRANTFLILGNPVTLLWMSVVSGYLVQAVGYRWMFIIEGLPAIGWAFLFRRLVDNRPSDADWLSEQECRAVEEAIDAEQRALPEPRGFRKVAVSWNAIVLSAQYLLWSVGVYGLVFWLPSIVKHLTQRGIGSTGLLTAVPYAAAIIAMLAVSAASDRLASRRVYTWIPLLISAACFGLSYLTRGGSFTVSFILLIVAAAGMYAPYGPYFAYIPELFPSADAAPATGMINAFGGLGGFVGTYIVGALGGGSSAVPFIFLAACLFLAALLMFAVRPPEHSAGAVPARQGKVRTEQNRATGLPGPAHRAVEL
ncbi:MAG: MFS transporter [Actinomycetota bacterium]|nr:MFS transporter [Actinomycetota bacterium]